MRMQNKRVRVILIVIVLLLIGYLGGLRVAHPHDGVGTSLGGAKTSLVIYRAGNSLAFEDKIIFSSTSGKPVLGIVAGTNGSSAYVNAGTRFEQVGQSQVRGKLLSVIPFVGSLFGIVGL